MKDANVRMAELLLPYTCISIFYKSGCGLKQLIHQLYIDMENY